VKEGRSCGYVDSVGGAKVPAASSKLRRVKRVLRTGVCLVGSVARSSLQGCALEEVDVEDEDVFLLLELSSIWTRYDSECDCFETLRR